MSDETWPTDEPMTDEEFFAVPRDLYADVEKLYLLLGLVSSDLVYDFPRHKELTPFALAKIKEVQALVNDSKLQDAVCDLWAELHEIYG